jgi:hypothetical protein
VIWVNREQEYFFERDWTGRNSLIRFRKLDFRRKSVEPHFVARMERSAIRDWDNGRAAPDFAEPVIGRRFAPTRWLHPGYGVLKPQNTNGFTETEVLPSAVCSTLYSTSFCAVVSPILTYNSPVQLAARAVLEFETMVSSRE